jgi:hypothetical protein
MNTPSHSVAQPPQSGPLPNPRHEAFAQAIASSQSAAAAYAGTYGQTRRHAAAVGGSRLLQKPAVLARVRALQSAAAQDVAADLRHLLHYLARVINTPISEVTASSDLCLRRKDTAHGEELAMPDKLTAVALAAKLQGFFRSDASPHPQPAPPPPPRNILTEEERLILIAQKRAASLAESEEDDEETGPTSPDDWRYEHR